MYMPLAVLSKIVPIVSRPKRASHGHRLDARFNGLVGSFVGWATLRYGTVFLAFFFVGQVLTVLHTNSKLYNLLTDTTVKMIL